MTAQIKHKKLPVAHRVIAEIYTLLDQRVDLRVGPETAVRERLRVLGVIDDYARRVHGFDVLAYMHKEREFQRSIRGVDA